MKNEFVPYDIALAMKELGFDEVCLGFYDDISKQFFTVRTDGWSKKVNENASRAPLYQQAFRWFREKYGLHPIIDSKWKNLKWEYDIISLEKYESICSNVDRYNFETPEEAQDACLRKLIEIVNQNKDEV
jgi:hypothetical protein